MRTLYSPSCSPVSQPLSCESTARAGTDDAASTSPTRTSSTSSIVPQAPPGTSIVMVTVAAPPSYTATVSVTGVDQLRHPSIVNVEAATRSSG